MSTQRKIRPSSIVLPTIVGDGVGEEIVPAIMSIHTAALSPFIFDTTYEVGRKAQAKELPLIPEQVINAFTEHKILLKGPLATPFGKGFKSINLQLRDRFNMHNNLRPAFSIPGINTPFRDVDIILLRENTEDLYANEAVTSPDGETAKVTFDLSKEAARNILASAVEIATKLGRKQITLLHKANIIKPYQLYIDVMEKEFAPAHPEFKWEIYTVDVYCERVVSNPKRFDVVVAPNLFGDIVSDVHAGMVGGSGMVPAANIGKEYAMFEAVHGSADGTDGIAGKNIANPTALLLSSCMGLRHVGADDVAEIIEGALFHVLLHEKEACTPDCNTDEFERQRKIAKGTTTSMTEAIVNAIVNQNFYYPEKRKKMAV